MSLPKYVHFFENNDEEKRISEVAKRWFYENGTPRTRALTQSMIFDTMKKYNLKLREAAYLFEKALLFYSDSHVVGGRNAYWELVEKMSEKLNENDRPWEQDPKFGKKFQGNRSSVMYAHLNKNKFDGFAETKPRAQIYSRQLPVQEVLVKEDPAGIYWGLWKDDRFVLVYNSKIGLQMAMGSSNAGEVDEIEESGVVLRVSVIPQTRYMSEAGVAPDAPPTNPQSNMSTATTTETSNINANRLLDRLRETRRSDLRRLLNKSLVAGDFDDDSDFKHEVEEFHQKLSTSKIGANKRFGHNLDKQTDFVSRPQSDGPDSEGSSQA